MNTQFLGLMVVVAIAGCGFLEGADIFDHRRVQTALVGVYEIDTWTVNESGCEREGPSVLDNQTNTLLFVQKYTFMWTDEWLLVGDCHELDSCKRLLAKGPLVSLAYKNFEFTDGSDSDGWTGKAARPTEGTGFGSHELPCKGKVGQYTMSVTKWPQIEIVSREAEQILFVEDERGECDVDTTKDKTDPVSRCTKYQVIRASMLEQYQPPI